MYACVQGLFIQQWWLVYCNCTNIIASSTVKLFFSYFLIESTRSVERTNKEIKPATKRVPSTRWRLRTKLDEYVAYSIHFFLATTLSQWQKEKAAKNVPHIFAWTDRIFDLLFCLYERFYIALFFNVLIMGRCFVMWCKGWKIEIGREKNKCVPHVYCFWWRWSCRIM